MSQTTVEVVKDEVVPGLKVKFNGVRHNFVTSAIVLHPFASEHQSLDKSSAKFTTEYKTTMISAASSVDVLKVAHPSSRNRLCVAA